MSLGTIAHAHKDGHYYFVTPDGVDEKDRSKQLFLHGKAVALGGINREVMLPGIRIEFDVVPTTRESSDARDTCQNVKLVD